MSRSWKKIFLMAAAATVLGTAPAHAINLLSPTDQIIPIDLDIPGTTSSTPGGGGEDALKVLDGSSATKYLNFGQNGSGFIVTPASGFKALRSFRLTTANDANERDPLTYAIYGTNETIVSGNNSSGSLEPWVFLGAGNTGLPTTRLTVGPLTTVANNDLYQSYRVVFPTVRNSGTANSMQVADVAFFETPDASSPNFLAVGDAIKAIDLNPASSTPGGGAEDPVKALDGNPSTKYLNFGAGNSGFIVKPSAGPLTIVTSFNITTANDAPERTPTSWQLYGAYGSILSGPNDRGITEDWTLIDSGTLSLSTSPFVNSGPIAVNNSTPYEMYRMVFPTVKNVPSAANSMQIADIQFEGSVVPEPSSFALAGIGLVSLVALRRRRR